MNPGQLDVRASVLAWCRFYRKAIERIDEALSRSDVSIDSRALLSAKLGEIYDKRGSYYLAEDSYLRVKLSGLKPTTEVRVLRSLAVHRLRKDKRMAGCYLQRAMGLAEKHNLGDQKVKILALMKEIGMTPNAQAW